ncbi:MAG TPA: hypothetical protein VMS78_05355 [Rhizomicrobium sp.]|nr:hypothetical protein [Rhizomicrobium sp.]
MRGISKKSRSIDKAFDLSRVYAEGWNASRKLSIFETDDSDGAGESLNPYTREPQRSRWAKGFAAGMGAPDKK